MEEWAEGTSPISLHLADFVPDEDIRLLQASRAAARPCPANAPMLSLTLVVQELVDLPGGEPRPPGGSSSIFEGVRDLAFV